MENKIRYGQNFIEVTFEAQWYFVESLWDFLRGLLTIMLRDSKRSDMISLSCVELAENAIKYTDQKIGYNYVDFRLHIDREKKKVYVIVKNKAEESHIKNLQYEIGRIKKHSGDKASLEEFFLTKLVESASIMDAGGRLGLIRIIHEAEGSLKYEIEDMTVIAKATFMY